MSVPDSIDEALECLRSGRSEEAVDLLHALLRVQPNHPRAHHALGLALRARGDLPGAVESLRRAVNLDREATEPVSDLADTLLAAGRAGEAVPLLREALDRFAGKAPLHGLLGDAFHAQGQLADAIGAYQRAVGLDPNLPAAWWGLACAQAEQGETASAAASFARAVELAPDFGMALHNRGKALFELGRIDEALDSFRRAASFLKPNAAPLGMIATIIPGSPLADDRAVQEARRDWAARWPTRSQAPLRPDHPGSAPNRQANQRLRVGYVSSFFDRRNWMKPVWGLINHHDRDRFEIHLFSDVPEVRIQAGYQRHPSDRFHDISALDNAAAARRIADAEIDILVDLNGYSKWARLPLFALRPAPLQVIWFGLYAPSGLDCFDYLVLDPIALPPGSPGEAFVNERIVRLATSYLSFEVQYPVPELVPPPCLAKGQITFGCLAPQYKLTPQTIEIWARILHACPECRLILKNTALGSESNRAAVSDAFARQQVSPEQVELQGPAEHFAFLQTYNAVDLTLDTFPYNGGTTTMESLWQGVPVLAFAGERWLSRISASLLHYAGLTKFIAADLNRHVEQAIALAHDPGTPDRLAGLRLGMRDRLRQAPVCDMAAFARQMEQEYERMWENPRPAGRPASRH